MPANLRLPAPEFTLLCIETPRIMRGVFVAAVCAESNDAAEWFAWNRSDWRGLRGWSEPCTACIGWRRNAAALGVACALTVGIEGEDAAFFYLSAKATRWWRGAGLRAMFRAILT